MEIVHEVLFSAIFDKTTNKFKKSLCREVLYINGASGMGKSWLINSFAKIYHVYYPDNKIFFLTMNDFEADRSLDHKLYTKVDMNEFLEQMDTKGENGETGLEEFSKSHDIHNCFFIFDDIGVLNNDKKKERTCWNTINMIIENKRKAQISIAVISHISCNYKQTALITREAKNYIFSPSNLQSNSDRMLKHYLGLTQKQLSYIMNEMDNSRWVSVNSQSKTVVSQFAVINLKQTR